MLKPTEQFKNATDIVIQRAREITSGMRLTASYDIGDTIYRIRNAFLDPDIRRRVVGQEYYEEIRLERKLYSAGFCIASSYVFAHGFTNIGEESPWLFRRFFGEHNWGTHVWLERRDTGDILDITFDQFYDMDGNLPDIPYHLGETMPGKRPFDKGYELADAVGPDFAAVVRQNSAIGKDM